MSTPRTALHFARLLLLLLLLLLLNIEFHKKKVAGFYAAGSYMRKDKKYNTL